MTTNCTTSWLRPRRGLTLIEALVGMAVLTTILVSVMLASSRLRAQSARTNEKLTGCTIADDFLHEHWARRGDLAQDRSGRVSGRDGWTWRTRVIDSPLADKFADEFTGRVVRLEIYAPGNDETAAANVEFLVRGGGRKKDDG